MLLLTNDDGIHADGMHALEKAAHQWQSDIITVAPLDPHHPGDGREDVAEDPLQRQGIVAAARQHAEPRVDQPDDRDERDEEDGEAAVERVAHRGAIRCGVGRVWTIAPSGR